MRTLKWTSAMLVLAAVAVLTASCEGYNPGSETSFEQMALAGGVSTHMKTEYARGEVLGTGEIDGECRTYEVLPIIYRRTTTDAGGPVDRQWIWVRVRMFCCDSDELLTTYIGSALLDDAEFTLVTHPSRNRRWEASVTKSVTLRNAANRTQLMNLNLDLDWIGVDDYRHRAENRFLDGEHVSNYELMYEIATLSGGIGLEGVTFDFGTQASVWIGDENRTTISR